MVVIAEAAALLAPAYSFYLSQEGICFGSFSYLFICLIGRLCNVLWIFSTFLPNEGLVTLGVIQIWIRIQSIFDMFVSR